MPVFISTLLHIAARGFFQVMSLALDITWSDCRRRIETTQVLGTVSKRQTGIVVLSYNPPRPNTIINAIFCRLGS